MLPAPFVFHKPIEDNLDTDSVNDLHYIADIMNTSVLCFFDLHSSPLSRCTISHLLSSFFLLYLLFNQFSPLYLCPNSNNCYYCPYTSLSSPHSLVLILTIFFFFFSFHSPLGSYFLISPPPVSACLFPAISLLPNSFSDTSYR